MADVVPAPAFTVGGFAASGQTSPLALASPGAPIFVASIVTAVAGSTPSLQVFADVLQDGTWVQVAALTAQNGAGVQSAVAQPPADTQGTWRLRWTVSGTGAEFFGKAVAGAA